MLGQLFQRKFMRKLRLFNRDFEVDVFCQPYLSLIYIVDMVEKHGKETIKYFWNNPVLSLNVIAWLSVPIICSIYRIRSKEYESVLYGILTLLVEYPFLLILGWWFLWGQNTSDRWEIVGILVITGKFLILMLIAKLREMGVFHRFINVNTEDSSIIA